MGSAPLHASPSPGPRAQTSRSVRATCARGGWCWFTNASATSATSRDRPVTASGGARGNAVPRDHLGRACRPSVDSRGPWRARSSRSRRSQSVKRADDARPIPSRRKRMRERRFGTPTGTVVAVHRRAVSLGPVVRHDVFAAACMGRGATPRRHACGRSPAARRPNGGCDSCSPSG